MLSCWCTFAGITCREQRSMCSQCRHVDEPCFTECSWPAWQSTWHSAWWGRTVPDSWAAWSHQQQSLGVSSFLLSVLNFVVYNALTLLVLFKMFWRYLVYMKVTWPIKYHCHLSPKDLSWRRWRNKVKRALAKPGSPCKW